MERSKITKRKMSGSVLALVGYMLSPISLLTGRWPWFARGLSAGFTAPPSQSA
jgi:hypothetical protein